MRKEYEDLLKSLETASQQARGIHAKGGSTDRVFRTLQAPIREVKDRIAYIDDVERRAAAEKKANEDAAKKAENTAPQGSLTQASPTGTVSATAR